MPKKHSRIDGTGVNKRRFRSAEAADFAGREARRDRAGHKVDYAPRRDKVLEFRAIPVEVPARR